MVMLGRPVLGAVHLAAGTGRLMASMTTTRPKSETDRGARTLGVLSRLIDRDRPVGTVTWYANLVRRGDGEVHSCAAVAWQQSTLRPRFMSAASTQTIRCRRHVRCDRQSMPIRLESGGGRRQWAKMTCSCLRRSDRSNEPVLLFVTGEKGPARAISSGGWSRDRLHSVLARRRYRKRDTWLRR